MDSKLSGPSFNTNLFSSFEENHSVAPGKSVKTLLDQLFFENSVSKVPAPNGDPTLWGEYPQYNKH